MKICLNKTVKNTIICFYEFKKKRKKKKIASSKIIITMI